MYSIESVEPLGFFSLPRELRDEIVSLKTRTQAISETPLLTEVLRSGQYDMLHRLQDEVEFGIDGQLVVRFPLPRLHHISRLFTIEYDSRAPARPLIVVTQKYGNFQTSKCVNGRQRMERIRCPRVVSLRHMQSHHFIKRLHIDMYACNATDGAAKTKSALYNSICIRLDWIRDFFQNTGSPEADVQLHIRLMLNDVEDIEKVKRFEIVRASKKRRPADGTIEIVVDCPSEQEYHEDEFKRAKTLAVWRPGSRWWFDEHEIRRCQALAELRSGWSTAATSPKSSDGECIGGSQEIGDLEELDEYEDPPVSPLTMLVTKISYPW